MPISVEDSYRYFDWTVNGGWDGIAYWGFIFGDYTEFAVGVRVPQWKKPMPMDLLFGIDS